MCLRALLPRRRPPAVRCSVLCAPHAALSTQQLQLDEKPAVVVKYRTVKKWLAQERETLQQIVASGPLPGAAKTSKKGGEAVSRTWQQITEEFNAVQAAAGLPQRSKSSVRHQYIKVISFEGKKGAFTVDEENAMQEAIVEFSLADQPQRDKVWDKVMERFPDRTKDQIYSWHNELKYKTYPNGAWTPEERDALVKAVPLASVTVPGDVEGAAIVTRTHWATVAKAVKTRSPKQCWLYYQRMVLPREAWKPVEYHRLFHLVTKFTSPETPTFWAKVSEAFLLQSENEHTPSDASCRMYWLRMAKRVVNLEWMEDEIRLMHEALAQFEGEVPAHRTLSRHELEEARWDFVAEYARQQHSDTPQSRRKEKGPLDYRIKAYFAEHPEMVKVLAPSPDTTDLAIGGRDTIKWYKKSSYACADPA